MTRRTVRRLAWVGVALCVVALAFGVTVRLVAPTPEVTEENVRRIRPGMTLAEVQALMGGPAYSTSDHDPDGIYEEVMGYRLQRSWRAAGKTVVVLFTKGERVALVERDADVADVGPLDRFRALLGR